MLILKYFLVVGAVLTAGLIALSAYLGPPPPAGIRAASSSLLPTVAPMQYLAVVPETRVILLERPESIDWSFANVMPEYVPVALSL